MRKIVITLCIIASGLLILDSIGVWHMLMIFLFIGVIPGTNITLAPGLMLILMSALTGLVIGVTFILPVMRKYYAPIKQVTLKSRRFSRI